MFRQIVRVPMGSDRACKSRLIRKVSALSRWKRVILGKDGDLCSGWLMGSLPSMSVEIWVEV